MKATFKPLSLAVAVAAASAGYVGIVNAQTVGPALAGNTGLGDLAIVPYYTVQAGYATGVHIINSSSTQTQVVKIRLRRQVDSMDALDFNVILSPSDVWTGYVQKDGDDVRVFTTDNSCTVPVQSELTMPLIYREGAEEGYIEVLGMGAANEAQPISKAAKHNDAGVPANCDLARENFFGGTTSSDYATAYPTGSGRTKGVINSALTRQSTVNVALSSPGLSAYTDTTNVLKVSWFIKSDVTGTEIGGDAVPIADFMAGPSITNQQRGINEGDLQGFDHPDLNGGAPTSVLLGMAAPTVGVRGSYEPVREALGAGFVINDWSNNASADYSVDTDWVITTPGQYLMTNLSQYIDSLEDDGAPCNYGDPELPFDDVYVDDEDADNYGANCDFRDIPLTVSAVVWDREERGIEVEEDDLVVSPQPPGEVRPVQFDQEVNVVQWGDVSVLGSSRNVLIDTPPDSLYGWASVSVEPNDDTYQAICDFTDYGSLPLPVDCLETSTPVPLVGFVAWQRNFTANPDANYGRAVDHSYTSSAP